MKLAIVFNCVINSLFTDETEDGTNIRQPNRVSFSDLNLWKIFPFAKRRREVLLHEIHIRFNQAIYL